MSEKDDITQRDYFWSSEVADFVGFNESYVNKLVRSNKMPVVSQAIGKKNKSRKIPKVLFDLWFEQEVEQKRKAIDDAKEFHKLRKQKLDDYKIKRARGEI